MPFVGIDDAYHSPDDLRLALGPSEPSEDDFRILLSHSPDRVREPLVADFPLAFSGHRHGGQTRLPGYGAPVRHAHSVGRREADGVVRRADAVIVISRGFGTTAVPLRIACRPALGVVQRERLADRA